MEDPVKIKTSRFGELQVNNTDIISFKDGILGFESLNKFFVVDPGDSTLILWLQSIEDGEVAFPIIEPKIFKPDYVAKLLPADMNALGLESLQTAKVYSILTIPQDVTKMTANLKAPIIINNSNKIGKQIVLQDSKLPVSHEMYLDLKKYIIGFVSDDSQRTTVQEPLATHETESASNNTEEPARNPSEKGL